MRTLLLDTEVFSYLFKNHSLADAHRSHVKGRILAISLMSVAASFQGAFRAGWGAKRIERLEEQINSYLVIPSSNPISRKWGEVRFIRSSHER